ncbi:polysaccharide deacetylase family protein [Paenibacillus sp. MMS20-IR301]|uniref:polysaccharide deacetylase family protein n=1 Tax=Paenibacillus sp. MMS20-IR301 TaxID=2895946 RepID=UPI0028E20C8F|nr:polysaccharide deacetylase family protein [Paenibacillus sp. MMS20-IR301]WNS42420.1 polysaccharide deacetylase family protein [Paenibacillus sp. MMS20-IR301]
MPGYPADAARMIELLSLEQRQGSYQMEVGFTCGSSFTSTALSIDEYTYVQLSLLGPFAGQRVRLSLYPKWDPFRRSFFSALTVMNHNFSETKYYACSGDYAAQLAGLRQEEQPAAPGYDDPASVELPETAPEARPSVPELLKRRGGLLRPARTVLLRGMLFSCLIALLLLRMDGKLFGSSAEAHEDSRQTAETSDIGGTAAEVVPVIRTAAYQSSQLPDPPEAVPLLQQPAAEAPQETAEPLPEAPDLVEAVELDGSSYEYSLPAGYVALTFDDGPSQYTRQIVDILDEHGVAANFLFIGQNASRYPGEVRYTAEHGMPVGSHSWDHSDMTRNSLAENRDNLERASRELTRSTGAAVTIFRPPYGAVNEKLAAEAGRQGMKLLLWNRDPEDWKADHPQQVLRYFQETDPSGGIYLLHEKAVTVQALPEILEYLTGKGLKFAVFQ